MGIKKGINIWSFPADMDLLACMKLAKAAGFDGIELALAGKGPLSMQSSDQKIMQVRAMAQDHGLTVSGLATGLYWQFSLTSDITANRERAKHIARRQIEAAALLGADAALVCPGAVGVDFKPEDVVPDVQDMEFFAGSEVIPYDVAYERAAEAFWELAPHAQAQGVKIGIENIWNKFLLSPLEMRDFVDNIGSSAVGVWLDVANMLQFGYPEHWIRILGPRIIKVHFKDYRRSVGGLDGFVDLLAGDVNWPAVMAALRAAGYEGWANGEMCPTYRYYTSQMIYNCSAAMDCILLGGRQGGEDK